LNNAATITWSNHFFPVNIDQKVACFTESEFEVGGTSDARQIVAG